jgi:hypothetical protein
MRMTPLAGPCGRAALAALLGLALLGCQGAGSDECGDADSCALPPFVVDGISYDVTCGSTIPVARLGRKLADVQAFGGTSPVRAILGVPADALVAIQVGGSDQPGRDESVPCGRAGAWLPGLPLDGDLRDSVLVLCEVGELSRAQRAANKCPTPTPTHG